MNQCWDIRVIWAVKFHMGALYAINSSMQDWQKEWGHVHQCVTTDHRPDLSDTQKNISFLTFTLSEEKKFRSQSSSEGIVKFCIFLTCKTCWSHKVSELYYSGVDDVTNDTVNIRQTWSAWFALPLHPSGNVDPSVQLCSNQPVRNTFWQHTNTHTLSPSLITSPDVTAESTSLLCMSFKKNKKTTRSHTWRCSMADWLCAGGPKGKNTTTEILCAKWRKGRKGEKREARASFSTSSDCSAPQSWKCPEGKVVTSHLTPAQLPFILTHEAAFNLKLQEATVEEAAPWNKPFTVLHIPQDSEVPLIICSTLKRTVISHRSSSFKNKNILIELFV